MQPQWHKATKEQKKAYQLALDDYLAHVNIPYNAITCNDLLECRDHYHDFSSFMCGILDACSRATKDCIPHSRPNKRNFLNEVPGWNEYVREKRESSMFWHERWKEQGRPRVGWLADMRRRTRSQYHLAVKAVKKNKDIIVKNKIADSLSEVDDKKFWMHMNKLKLSKPACSEMIDGRNGVEACNVFKDKYKSLYNTAQDNNIQYVAGQIREQISCKCMYERSMTHLHSVTMNQVQKAIGALKSGQLDNSCSLVSDCFIYGSYRLYVMLAFLFTVMIRHGFSCSIFNVVALIPIPKNKRKSLADSDNYRAIAPNSSLAKILDYIVIQQFPEVFETEAQQFAYKSNFSTSMCTFMVLETIQYYRANGSDVYVTLLDCSKAFDMVNFEKLFNCLNECGMCPLITRFLLNMYTSSEYYVRWNGMSSDSFPVKNGVKQGGVLSPLLFTLYTNPLIGKIVKTGLGCHIGDKCASIFIYADDIILLSPSRSAMQSLIDNCNNFANEFTLKFNPTKCKFMIFSDTTKHDVRLTLGGLQLMMSESEKHLGHILSTNRDLIDFNSVINDIKVRSNCIRREFSYLDTNAKIKLFNAHCTSFYGCNLMDISSNQFEQIDRSWRVSVRYLLGLESRTHRDLLPGIVGTMSASDQIISRMTCFFRNGLKHDSDYISFFFMNCKYGTHSYMGRNMNIILRKYEIQWDEIINNSTKWIKKHMKNMTSCMNWKIPIIKELLLSRDGVFDCGLDREEVITLLRDLCIS